MPNLALYYNTSDTIVPQPVTFLNTSGVAVDPTIIRFVLTDPTGTSTTYTYTGTGSDPNVVMKDSTGKYHINLQLFNSSPGPAGLYNFVWAGIGVAVANGAQITTGSFRVYPLSDIGGTDNTYCSIEELKSSLGVAQTETKDDFEMRRAVISATSLVNDLCGQHFYQITEPRKYSYMSISELIIDPFVPGTITQFALDYDGDGVYETTWTENVNYITLRYAEQYAQHNLGEARPHDSIQVLLAGVNTSAGGQFLPFIWAWTPKDRVKITATWGWAAVPHNVHHAALLLAVDLFKMKDAPWGIAGTSELGLVRTQANPQIMELLARYQASHNIVGV